MEKILRLIKQGKYSLVVLRNRKLIFTSKEKGIKGLLFAKRHNFLNDSLVFDKTIGLAAAKICFWAGVRKIFCFIASEKAINFLLRNKIKIKAEKIVREIVDDNNSKCLIEKIAEKTKYFSQFSEKINQLKNNANDVKLAKAPKNGVFPDNYYTTTNLKTWIKLKNKLIEVKHAEMDKGIRVSKDLKNVETVWSEIVRQNDLIVADEDSERIKTEKLYSIRSQTDFGFMSNNISTERSKETIIKKIAKEMSLIKKNKGKILFVAGPAVIHTGAGKYFARLIKNSFVNMLFSGNALAVHDLEKNLLGTSLGFNLAKGILMTKGYHYHLRMINLVRKYGSIQKMVEAGLLKSGVMYECLKNKIDFVLCGSIRDDGPLPEVITDTQKSQATMRSKIRKGIDLAIMTATTLHSIAVGNLLPAEVKKIVVDINPSVVIKLSDRGTNAYGITTDVELFFNQLCKFLNFQK